MYTYFQAYALSRSLDSQFETVDLSQMPMETIYNNYSQVFLSLNYSYATNQIYTDLNMLKEKYRTSTLTLTEVIAAAPNGYFYPLSDIPYYRVNYSRYMDSQLAGYHLTKQNNDLVLNNPKVSSNDFLKYCLVSINGFILPTTLVNNQITVADAYSQIVLNNNTRVGILSFEEVNPISILPITADMIFPATNRTLHDMLYIKSGLSDQYVTMLVMNGYVIAPTSNGFFPVGNGVFNLSLRKLGYDFKLVDSLPHQIYNYNYILSQLPSSLTSQYTNIPPNTVSVPLIQTANFISQYLTLPNSFLVQVQTSNILVKSQNILNTQLECQLISNTQPLNILTGSQGRIVDYFYSYDKGKFVITSPYMHDNNYVQLKNRPIENGYISRQRLPYNAVIKSTLFWKQYGFYSSPYGDSTE